jgi:transcription elongation factor Elf1
LVDDKEPLRIYIAVDPTKVSRCKWCGTTQSEKWKGDQYGGIFCSTECSLAYYANMTLVSYPLLTIFFPLAFSSGISVSLGALLPFFALFALLFSPLLCFGGAGTYQRMHIPKDSRRDDVPIDVAMLKAMSSTVLCPRCDANIDVSKVGKDMTYTCEYCGVSGTIEIMNTSQSSSRPFSLVHKESDDSAKESLRVKCTLCGAVYSYKKSSVSEGSLVCQNCGKSFKIAAT